MGLLTRKRRRLEYQNLEDRLCLTAIANVNHLGVLHVVGNADGMVSVEATGTGTFDVSDDSVSLGSFEGVNRIWLSLDRHNGDSNTVNVNLHARWLTVFLPRWVEVKTNSMFRGIRRLGGSIITVGTEWTL